MLLISRVVVDPKVAARDLEVQKDELVRLVTSNAHDDPADSDLPSVIGAQLDRETRSMALGLGSGSRRRPE